MSSTPKTAPFRVGELTLDPVDGSVRGGPEPLRLEPKVMAVLTYLVANRDRIVGKEELLERLWPDASVEEVALPRCISEIRRVLGDDVKHARFIQTFHRRGYQWIGPLETVTSPRSSGWSKRTFAAGAAAIGLGLAVWRLGPTSTDPIPPSVAVLPFDDLSSDSGKSYFADGVTEDVITQISKIEGIRVISKLTAMSYRDTGKSARDIARELNVATLLEGTVRKDTDRVRITGKLIDARTDTQLWAESYDRTLDDVLAVQRDIAERIAAALETELSERERRILGELPEVDGSVYDDYLRARSFYSRLDAGSNVSAIEILKTAVERDPNFALGYAGLADAYARRRNHTGDGRWGHLAVEEAKRSLALEPNLPEAHKAIGHAYAELGRSHEATLAYEMALELRPGYTDALNNLAVVYGDTGAWDRALSGYTKLLPLDPASTAHRANFGSLLAGLGHDSEAIAWLQYALAQEPFFLEAHRQLANLDILNGRLNAARDRLERLSEVTGGCQDCLATLGLISQLDNDDERAREYLERSLDRPGDTTVAELRLASIAWTKGDHDRAERALDNAERYANNAMEQKSEWWGPRWSLAAAASIRGDIPGATRWLGEAVASGRLHHRWDRMDPLFEIARQDAGFVALLLDMEKRVEAMKARSRDIPMPPRDSIPRPSP